MSEANELEAIRARVKNPLQELRIEDGYVPSQSEMLLATYIMQAQTDAFTLLRLLDAARETQREIREAAGPFVAIANRMPKDRPLHRVVCQSRDALATVANFRRLAAAVKE